MKAAGRRVRGNAVGVLDAGVVLVRLDRRHPRHGRAVELFHRSGRGELALHISVVNLAEVLEHARPYTDATGLDPLALLAAFRIEPHAPDVETAREVARLASVSDLSLADRFALATSMVLGARLHTTDRVLAEASKQRKVPVTRF